MSCRKFEKTPKPNSSSKSKRGTPSNSVRGENSNPSARPNCSNRLNMTNISLIVQPPSYGDLDLPSTLAYGNYLQSLMMVQILNAVVKEHTIYINDQLSLQADLLLKQMIKKDVLEEDIEKLVLQAKCKNLIQVTQNLIDVAKKNINDDLKDKLNILVKIADEACSFIYLKNVKPLASQEEYIMFEELLNKCNKSLARFVILVGDVEGTQQFAGCLETYEKLCKETAKIESEVIELQKEAQTAVLSSVADNLAACRGYN